MPWEETERYIRSGHRSVEEFEEGSLRTIEVDPENGIKAIVGKPKNKEATEVLSYLFDKERGWTIDKAKRWFEEHSNEVLLLSLRFHTSARNVKERRIKGIAAYAGKSRNNNLYLPDELKRADGQVVPVYWEHDYTSNPIGYALLKWNPELEVLEYDAELNSDLTAPYVSIGAEYEWEELFHGLRVPRNLRFYELSLTENPGFPLTSVQVLESKRRIVEHVGVTQTTPAKAGVGVATQSPKSGEGGERMSEKSGVSKEQTSPPYVSFDELRSILADERKAMVDAIKDVLRWLRPEDRKNGPRVSNLEETPSERKEQSYEERFAKLMSEVANSWGKPQRWTVPTIEVPYDVAGLVNLLNTFLNGYNRIKEASRRVREALSSSDVGVGEDFVAPPIVLPAGLPAGLRNTAIVETIPRGAGKVTWRTVTSPSFAPLAENTEPTEVAHTFTAKTATPSLRGWQQSISVKAEEGFANGDVLAAISESARVAELLDEDGLILSALDGETSPAGTLYGDESVSSEAEVTSSMTFSAARLRTAIRLITEQGHDPSGLVCVVHPVQYQALLADSNISQAQQYGSAEAIQAGVIPSVYGVEVRRSTKTPTGTGFGGITTYHAFVYKRNFTVGLGVGKDITIEMDRDVRKLQTVIKAYTNMAATILVPSSLVKVITA